MIKLYLIRILIFLKLKNFAKNILKFIRACIKVILFIPNIFLFFVLRNNFQIDRKKIFGLRLTKKYFGHLAIESAMASAFQEVNKDSKIILMQINKYNSSPTILAIINQKGVVGKTTTVINLAAALSIMGRNNLIIDLDPQGNATTGLGRNNKDENKNIYNQLIKKNNIENAIQQTHIQNIDKIKTTVN